MRRTVSRSMTSPRAPRRGSPFPDPAPPLARALSAIVQGRWAVRKLTRIALAIACAAAVACRSDPGRLEAELVGAATADPLIFHGDCLAGWMVAVDLQLSETHGADVLLDLLSYRMADDGRDIEIGSESMNGTTIEERYGSRVVPAHGARIFRIGLQSSTRPEGPILVSGDAVGLDQDGNGVRHSFHFSADLVVHDPEPPLGGACPPS